jgi:hypothetical protein
VQVIVVANEAIDDLPFPTSEDVGRTILLESGFDGQFFQCSYNAAFRGFYPGIGWIYDETADVFVPPILSDELP